MSWYSLPTRYAQWTGGRRPQRLLSQSDGGADRRRGAAHIRLHHQDQQRQPACRGRGWDGLRGAPAATSRAMQPRRPALASAPTTCKTPAIMPAALARMQCHRCTPANAGTVTSVTFTGDRNGPQFNRPSAADTRQRHGSTATLNTQTKNTFLAARVRRGRSSDLPGASTTPDLPNQTLKLTGFLELSNHRTNGSSQNHKCGSGFANPYDSSFLLCPSTPRSAKLLFFVGTIDNGQTADFGI